MAGFVKMLWIAVFFISYIIDSWTWGAMTHRWQWISGRASGMDSALHAACYTGPVCDF